MKAAGRVMIFFILMTCGVAYGQNYNEILGRPTDSSITVSVMFDQVVDLYIEYGTTSGVYPNTTSQITNVVNTPDEIELTGLNPDTKYFYRTRYRLTGNGSFQASAEHFFHTQRAPGSTFTFTVEADEHMYDKKGVINMYNITLGNEATDKPDFMISLGDTYGDDHHPESMTSGYSDTLHRYYRPFLGSICHSIPYFFCLGNHEGEFNYYMNQNPPNNIAVWGTLWRKFYYAGPVPDHFYSGDTTNETYGMGQPENYYAWTWGDALFVVLDAYRYQSISDTTPKPQKWDWTLGFTQYTWLKNTLENSTAKYKFVFIHQLRGQGRGGILDAPYYEWGGYDGNGNWLFDTQRPGWAKPIHQLMVDNGVNILFHGHDHLFAHEVLDSLVYQEVPMPSDSTYHIGVLANGDAYATDTIYGSGHIRVQVSPECIKVDFVRAWLPADTLSGVHHNREVAFSYTIGNCPSGITNTMDNNTSIEVYPNPATNNFNIQLPDELDEHANVQINLINTLGQTVLQTTSLKVDVSSIPDGLYFLNITSDQGSFSKRVIVCK